MKDFYTKDSLKEWTQRGIASVGRHTYGSPNILHWGEKATLSIGNFCSISDKVTIFLGGNHRADWITTYPFSALGKSWSKAEGIMGHPATRGNVEIGNDVWIGYGATILSGVTIGDGAVIGANSVVAKDVLPYAIVAGNPAREIRKRFTDDQIKKLLHKKWWNWTDEEIGNSVSLLCSADIEEFLQNKL